ncbi:MAG TPA: hypothetical protein VJV03_18235 [Pyrinomonadaceae bacterium]|nr:hypothetical protein [Pyrinomonadaceae bacterium]
MKRLLLAALLSCAVSVTTFAGNIPTVGVTPPSPPPDGIQATTAPVEVPTVGFKYEIADSALDFIQLVLSAGI